MVAFTTMDWISVSAVVFIMGMSKGGFPVSGVALPLLVLLWPGQGESARSAVSFMLPLLCTMDLIGAYMYRKNIDWLHIRSLLPGMLAGVLLASIFFVADKGIAVSDQVLKITIGSLGIVFSVWHLLGKPSTSRTLRSTFLKRASIFGFGAGLSSTIAHAAGPVMQMYFLPTGLNKKAFAGTTVYFFLILNSVKLIPFALLGRFDKQQLTGSLWFLPIIPVGVISGYMLVKLMKQKQYTHFIHITLAITSVILIIKAFN